MGPGRVMIVIPERRTLGRDHPRGACGMTGDVAASHSGNRRKTDSVYKNRSRIAV